MYCSDIQLTERSWFTQCALADNWECVTLAVRPAERDRVDQQMTKLKEYCKERNIEYILFPENQQTNHHFHGIMGFPHDPDRKRFQTYCNRNIGKFHVSPKGDVNNWYNYVTKQIKQIPINLFDPVFEPPAHAGDRPCAPSGEREQSGSDPTVWRPLIGPSRPIRPRRDLSTSPLFQALNNGVFQ